MKNKKPLRKIGTYFRELSIITIGVAITLAISAWLNYFNDKKNLKLYLNAVKLELEENKVHFENRRDFVQHSANYANYLKSTQINSLNSDSINKYMNIIYNFGSFPLQTSAFEMLKISGMMRLIDDKKLLSLWKTYNELSDAKFMIEEIMRYKKEEAVREMHAGLSGAFNLPAPLYTFFAYDLPQTMLLLNEKAIVAIEKALLNFE